MKKQSGIKALASRYNKIKQELDKARHTLKEYEIVYEQEFNREMDDLESERLEREAKIQMEAAQRSREGPASNTSSASRKIKLDIKENTGSGKSPPEEGKHKAKVEVKKKPKNLQPQPQHKAPPPPPPQEDEQQAAKRKPMSNSKLREIAENLYMILCKAFHPDRSGEEDKFRELQQKYETGDSSGIIFMGLEADAIDVDEELGEEVAQDVQQELECKIQDMQRQLDNIKHNIAWVWCQKRTRDQQLILRHRIIQKMRQNVLGKIR